MAIRDAFQRPKTDISYNVVSSSGGSSSGGIGGGGRVAVVVVVVGLDLARNIHIVAAICDNSGPENQLLGL